MPKGITLVVAMVVGGCADTCVLIDNLSFSMMVSVRMQLYTFYGWGCVVGRAVYGKYTVYSSSRWQLLCNCPLPEHSWEFVVSSLSYNAMEGME